MPSLPFPDQQKVKFHLSYSGATPIGDTALLQERMDNIPSTELVTQIQGLITRCDRVFAQSEMNQQTAGIAYNRIITGDTNRADREDRPESLRVRQKAYLAETNLLALRLGVMNYTSPSNAGYLHFGVVKQ